MGPLAIGKGIKILDLIQTWLKKDGRGALWILPILPIHEHVGYTSCLSCHSSVSSLLTVTSFCLCKNVVALTCWESSIIKLITCGWKALLVIFMFLIYFWVSCFVSSFGKGNINKGTSFIYSRASFARAATVDPLFCYLCFSFIFEFISFFIMWQWAGKTGQRINLWRPTTRLA